MHPRRLLQALPRIVNPSRVGFAGLVIVALGAWMAWAPLGVILFGMTLVLSAAAAVVAGPPSDDSR